MNYTYIYILYTLHNRFMIIVVFILRHNEITKRNCRKKKKERKNKSFFVVNKAV